MTPVKCLVLCKNANSRFGLLHQGNTCHCFKSLPIDDLIPLPGDKCNFPCTGDNNQLCGGIASYAAYVHDCMEGWTRFSDSCYQLIPEVDNILSNADKCIEMGGNLWSPQSFDDAEFVELMFNSYDLIHIGWMAYKHEYGFVSVDGTYNPGVDFVSHNFDSSSIFDDNDNLLSLDSCVVFSIQDEMLQLKQPCPLAVAVCQQPLGNFTLFVLHKLIRALLVMLLAFSS